jgi:hypothetical protein
MICCVCGKEIIINHGSVEMNGAYCGKCINYINSVDLSECKPIGKIIAEELDQKIAKDIIDVFKKYFTDTKIDEKKVLRLARMLIDTESEGKERPQQY